MDQGDSSQLSVLAVVGPTADLLVSLLGNYVGTPIRPVTPLDGLLPKDDQR